MPAANFLLAEAGSFDREVPCNRNGFQASSWGGQQRPQQLVTLPMLGCHVLHIGAVCSGKQVTAAVTSSPAAAAYDVAPQRTGEP